MKNLLYLFFILCISLLSFISCNNDDNSHNSSNAPSVTLESYDIKVVSVKLKGIADIETINSDRMGVTKYGFIISEYNNPTKENGWTVRCYDITTDGIYTALITNLIPDTKYYYCAVFYDGAQYQYGEVKSFTTNSFSETFLNCQTEVIGNDVTFHASIKQKELGSLTQFQDCYKVYDTITAYASINDYSDSDTYLLSHTLYRCSEGVDYTYVFSIYYEDNYGEKIILGNTERKFTISTSVNANEVDLGLSVIWKGTNIGATSPEQLGNMYAWGETNVKDNYTLDNYIHGTTPEIGNIVEENTYNKIYDISGTEYDVVKKVLGGDWVMPNREQLKELVDNCKWEFIQLNRQYGYKGTSKINGKTIFIPSCDANAAYIWGSDARVGYNECSPASLNANFYMATLSIGVYYYSNSHYKGKPIRGVRAIK